MNQSIMMTLAANDIGWAGETFTFEQSRQGKTQ